MITTCQPVEQSLLNWAISAYSATSSAPTQLHNHRLLISFISAYSDTQLVSVSRLISACQPVDQDLSASRSAPTKMRDQLRDQRLLSHLVSTCPPLYQHLSDTISAPVSCLMSTCQPVEQRLLSRTNSISQPVDLCLLSTAISAYSAAQSVPVSRLRSTCQPLDQHPSAA